MSARMLVCLLSESTCLGRPLGFRPCIGRGGRVAYGSNYYLCDYLYMVHPRLECGPFLGRNEGMRSQPKMVALASTSPETLDTSQSPYIAPHLRPKAESEESLARLAPSQSQKASSFSWNCLRNCIRSICYNRATPTLWAEAIYRRLSIGHPRLRHNSIRSLTRLFRE